PGDLVEVRTPNAVAGIRGTVIVAEVFDSRHSVITVLKGVIDVTRLDAGRLVGPSTILNALQQVTIGGAVSSPQPVSSDTARSMRDEFRTVPPRRDPTARRPPIRLRRRRAAPRRHRMPRRRPVPLQPPTPRRRPARPRRRAPRRQPRPWRACRALRR